MSGSKPLNSADEGSTDNGGYVIFDYKTWRKIMPTGMRTLCRTCKRRFTTPKGLKQHIAKSNCSGRPPTPIEMKLEKERMLLLKACKLLVNSFITGEHYHTMNPYGRPEVIAGLEALKECGIINELGEWKEMKK